MRFAGSFYPSDKEELEEEVKEMLSLKKENVKMGIVPHAGWMFSGRLAGDVIGRILEKKNFIIFGVNHSGIGGKISFSMKDFQTPLGIVKNNQALTNKIIKKLDGEFQKSSDFRLVSNRRLIFEINVEAHENEHSIEVQLPFLQQSQKKFEIVPILLKNLDYEDCKKIAKAISEIIDDVVFVLISSDFTHYGKSYGFTPFKDKVRKNLYYLDNEIIINILNKNSKKVFELGEKSTVCGVYGLTIATEISKIKEYKGKLVEYYTSGDVVDNWDNVVGYGGIGFS